MNNLIQEPDENLAREVAENLFGLRPPVRVKRLDRGRVNRSFLIETVADSYVLQRLSPIFSPGRTVVENMVETTARLAAGGLPAPQVIPALSGTCWAEHNGVWRLMTALPGRNLARPSVKAVSEAASTLGLFHRLLLENPPDLKIMPPDEYNRDVPAPPEAWPELIEQFKSNPRFDRAEAVLRQGWELARNLPLFLTPTRAILHGDPKLDNFLFNAQGQVTGLVDLDTVRRGTLLWELADFLRSAAGVRRRDSGSLTLSASIYREAVESYRRHGAPLTAGEWEQLPAAVRAVVLNLARRYLKDYFEEAYFVWDRRRYTSLADQNLRRGSALVALAASLAAGEQTAAI